MERKKTTGPKVKMMSFRFSKETAKHLASLSKYYGHSNTEIIENLIVEEIERLKLKKSLKTK